MNLLYKRLYGPSSMVAVFQLPASELQIAREVRLLPEETIRYDAISNNERRIEFIGQRFIVQQHISQAANITYNPLGKPDLSNGGKISVSHSHGFIAVQTSRQFEVGVDLQVMTPKLERIKQRFLSEEEWSRPELEDLRTLHIYWCAKEAMFKYYAKGDVDFRKELFVERFEPQAEGIFYGVIRKGGGIRVALRYKSIGDCILVYTDSVLLH